MKRRIEATHTAPELDLAVAFWLYRKFGPETKKKPELLFLRGPNEPFQAFENVILFDRGRGPFDHHRRGVSKEETTASLVAKELKVDQDKNIQQLLSLAKRSDRQGISLSFDLSDITKCMQRNPHLTDEERIELGMKIVEDTMRFREEKLERDHPFAQKIIVEFLAEKKRIPIKFRRYLQKLENERFERPFDFVEIITSEKVHFGEAKAVKFAKRILELIYIDTKLLFSKATKEVEDSLQVKIRDLILVAGVSDNPKFNTAARKVKNATVIVQRNSNGQSQIFFDTKKINDRLPEALISVIRLEECLIQERPIPKVDLRRSGTIREVPEWHYFKAPRIGKKKPGRFIFNGSLTAPDVPVSKIPFETLIEITQDAIRYHRNFNWPRWQAERMAHYINQKN